ncbi:hypothetical protein PRIPAC_72754 [Pristionchus pacificus]|uniref:Hydrolase n=1 Tax=Pristionchus pacificus TaxID=54126 RepID=A0A2A6D0C1_PRIPA|nr:hypothetical protein PRIPAC_72754 [Pristionchus pacificus]|eukprot:PDM83855.1 hydrolase [Pristionchus pacificus]
MAILALLSLFLLIPSIYSTTTADVKKTKYNETLSEMLLHLSAAAYGQKKDECVKNTFPLSEGRFLYSSINKTCDIVSSTCESFIVTSKIVPETIIIFRGTKQKAQLLLEGWASYREGVGFNTMGRVNRDDLVNSYFSKALNSLWDPIYEFLKDAQYKHHSIIFTGHSLGGAVASLAAAQTVKLKLRNASQVRMYTFGQPRTGSYKYAMNYDALGIESYRIVYGSDVIPHQPPCKKDMNIPPNEEGARACSADDHDESYHHGTEIWYPLNMTSGSLYIECLGAPKNEDFNCSNMLTYSMDNKEQYVWDHRHYFDVSLSNFGKSGCTNRTKKAAPKKSKWSKVFVQYLSVLRSFFTLFVDFDRMLHTTLIFIFTIVPSASLFRIQGRHKSKFKYDENLSEMLLHLSSAAYGEIENRDECVRKIMPEKEEWSRFSTLSSEVDGWDNTCAGYIITSKKKKKAIVVFRGTKSVEQLILEAWASRGMGNDFHEMGKVHEYFGTAIEAMWGQIKTFLNRISYEKYSIIFTGHSLGGALASLAAAKTVKNGKISPGLQNDIIEEHIFSYRVVFRKDSVPHSPECKTDGIAANENGATYPDSMTPDSNFILCDGYPRNEDFNCSNRYTYPYFNKDIAFNFWDHRHYFDVSLVNFGKSGCENRVKKPDPTRSKLPLGIDTFFKTFGKKLEDLSKTLLHLSAAAYGTDDNRKHTLPANEEWQVIANLDVESDFLYNHCAGFIARSHRRKMLIVVFRGTKKPEQLVAEILKSFTIGKDFYGMGKVHKYFRKAIEKMWQPIQDHGYSIIFTGHSLGAALASLATAKTLQSKKRKANEVQLYTFGQPRTGSLNFSRSMDNFVHRGLESYRIVYGKDLVPHFPACHTNSQSPANVNGIKPCSRADDDGFYHHGTEYWYPDSMSPGSKFRMCTGDPNNEDINCSNQYEYPLLDSEIELKAWDHRHYFGVSLVNFGKSGCTNRTNKPEPKTGIEGFASFASMFKCKEKKLIMFLV